MLFSWVTQLEVSCDAAVTKSDEVAAIWRLDWAWRISFKMVCSSGCWQKASVPCWLLAGGFHSLPHGPLHGLLGAASVSSQWVSTAGCFYPQFFWNLASHCIFLRISSEHSPFLFRAFGGSQLQFQRLDVEDQVPACWARALLQVPGFSLYHLRKKGWVSWIFNSFFAIITITVKILRQTSWENFEGLKDN